MARGYDRDAFNCGDRELNDFLRRHARQSHERGGGKTFVAIDETGGTTILGFYSLAPVALAYARTSAVLRRGLARHDAPGFRLARLAVAEHLQRQGLGGRLLGLAGRRCLRAVAEVGGAVLIIDAKTGRAAEWYAAHGALPLPDAPLTLVMPLATVEAAWGRTALGFPTMPRGFGGKRRGGGHEH